MATTKTLQNMRDVAYAILKEKQDTTAYPYIFMDVLINSAQHNICSGNVSDIIQDKKLEKGPLPFLYSDKYYTSVQDTYLSSATSIGATSLSASNSSSFASSGNLWINEDIVAYTGNASNTLTGVTGVDFAHKGGSRVSQLYSLPTDFASSVRVTYNNQIALKSTDYRDIYLQLNSFKGYDTNNNMNTTIDRWAQDVPPFYTLIQGAYFLPFQISNSGYMFHMIYEKIATNMSAASDVCTIPDEYSEQTIPLLAVGDMLYYRGEEARGLELLRFAYGKILSMYDYYMNQNNESMNNQRITTGKDQILNI